jgi:hypothetical protein
LKTPEAAPPGGACRYAASSPLFGALFAAAVVVLIYWPARQNLYIWDDTSYLVFGEAYRDPARWFEALFQPPTGAAVFRPLTLLTFAMPLWFGIDDPRPHHLANIFMHAGNVVLLALLAWRVFHGRFSNAAAAVACAALTGLVYGLHPALTEAVLWIACRFDLMMTFFLLLALLADRHLAEGGRVRVMAICALFLFALLCKETAVGFLAAIPLAHLAFSGKPGDVLQWRNAIAIWARNGWVYAGLSLTLAVYLGLRYWLLGSSLGLGIVMTRYDEIGSLAQRSLVVFASLTEYISDVLWFSLNVQPNRVLVIPVEGMERVVPALVGSLGVVLIATGAVFRSRPFAVAGLFVLAFLASLLPLANIVPAPTYAGELQTAVRYVTFPAVFIGLGACSLMPAPLDGAAMRRPGLRALGGLLVVAWLAASAWIVRSTIPLWQNEGVFYRWAISLAPPNSWSYLYGNLGGFYLVQDELTLARDAFTQAILAKPRSQRVASIAWYNLGNVEEKLGNPGQAREIMRATLAVDPGNIYARASLARLERNAGNAEVAATLAADGLQRGGVSPQAALLLEHQLGMALIELKRFDDAAVHLERVLAAARDPQQRAEAAQALERARGRDR